MEKKQSSIDFLIEQLEAQGFLYDLDILQAKAMHKEEIEEAYMVGNHSKMRGGRTILQVTEKYYNENFKSE